MLIKLHGIFKERYGPEVRIEADTVVEAIEGFSRQVDFYGEKQLFERPLVRVVEVNSLSDLLEPTEHNEIHLVPAMVGGGGVGKIIIGAAIIATAFLLPAVGVPLAAWVTTGLVTIGATLVMQGAMQLFMKAPTISVKGSQDPEASKYFGLSDNTVAIGTPIPIQYGRGPATGHLLAINIDAKDIVYGQFPTTPT